MSNIRALSDNGPRISRASFRWREKKNFPWLANILASRKLRQIRPRVEDGRGEEIHVEIIQNSVIGHIIEVSGTDKISRAVYDDANCKKTAL